MFCSVPFVIVGERQGETRSEEESLAAVDSCTVSKTDVKISILAISFGVLVYRHAQQICEVVIAIHYPERGVKGGITNGRQCPIITASPEEHRRVKLAQRPNQRTQHGQKTENSLV